MPSPSSVEQETTLLPANRIRSAVERDNLTEERKPKRLASNLILAAVTLVVSLLAAEIATRVLYAVPLHPTDTYLSSEGDLTPALLAGTETHHVAPQFEVTVSINSHGLRDVETPYEKPAGERRVLCVGDSFTFGQGVELDECFVKVAESLMPDEWRCINTGVPGWGTADELDFIEHEGFKYDPDIVAICFFGNDIRDNGWRDTYRLDLDGKPFRVAAFDGYDSRASPESDPVLGKMYTRRHGASTPPKGASWWVRNSNLYRLARQAASRSTQSYPDPRAENTWVDDRVRERRPLTAALLAEMTRQCAERDIATVILLIPYPGETTACEETNFRDKLRDVTGPSEELGARVVDVAPALLAAGGEDAYFPKDMHANAVGHAAIGRELADALLEVTGE